MKKFKMAVIKNVISQEICDLVTQYCLFDEMQNIEKNNFDDQVPNAYSKIYDPLMESILLKIQPDVESVYEKKLLPSYSYFRIYSEGDELKKHIDRESCEISATLCFNYQYEDDPWPIFIDDEKIILYPGDMAVYKGNDLYHYREKLTGKKNIWHIQGFFHYVESDGKFKDFKFDGRNSIGEIK